MIPPANGGFGTAINAMLPGAYKQGEGVLTLPDRKGLEFVIALSLAFIKLPDCIEGKDKG